MPIRSRALLKAARKRADDKRNTFDPKEPDRYFRTMLKGAKKRAKKHGRVCTLTFKWIKEKCKGGCSLTGMEFVSGRFGTYRSPRSPSIHRIDSNGDYTEGNCIIVAYQVNAAIGQWPEKFFWQMCESAYHTIHNTNGQVEVTETGTVSPSCSATRQS